MYFLTQSQKNHLRTSPKLRFMTQTVSIWNQVYEEMRRIEAWRVVILS